MKVLKIILVVILLLTAIPLNGFCDDVHSHDVTHHCDLVCHAPCCQSTLPNNTFGSNLLSESTFFLSRESRSHEDPFLSTSKRPPIVLS